MIYIKTKKEIDLIRESCRIVAETLQLVKRHVKPGVSTFELDKIAEDYVLSNNSLPAFKGVSQGGGRKFPGTICASIDEEVVHGIPSDRKLVEGQIISIDMGVIKNKYYSDAAITVPVGNVSEVKMRLIKVTEESLYKGIGEAKANNRVRDISAAVQEYVEANGFSVVRDLCGHGVGRYLHEDPSIPNFGKRGTGSILKNGMTIAIEPMVNTGIYDVAVLEDEWTVVAVDGLPSAHFEHTIVIIDDKPEILTVC